MRRFLCPGAHESLVVVAVAAVITMSIGGPAFAEVTTPRARVNARRNGDVRVKCFGYRGAGSRDLTTVELERCDDGVSFEPLATIERPKRSQSYDDAPGATGEYWYRCRVVSDTGTSGWSNPAWITMNAPAPAPPQPTATPRPTATATPKPQPTATATPANPGDPDPPLATGQHECPDGSLDEVLALVNQARRDAGRAPLSGHPQLMWSARLHSIWMASNESMTHDGWVEGIRASGYTGGWLGQNIAFGYSTPASVMQVWMASTGHRTNILSATYRDLGVGCVVEPNGTFWWTQDFGG